MKITSHTFVENQSSSLSRYRQVALEMDTKSQALHAGDKNSSVLRSSQVSKASGSVEAADSDSQGLSRKLSDRAAVFLNGEDGVIFLSADKVDRMNAVLERLNEKQQNLLIDSLLISNEEFLSLAEALDDSQIRQFADIADALKVPPKRNNIPNVQTNGSRLKFFVDTLNGLNTQMLTQILDRAELESKKVVESDSSAGYDRFGLNTAPSSSANDLNNFLQVINKSDDIDVTFEDISAFSERQQSDLLAVMVGTGLGQKLVEQLKGQPDQLKTDLLTFMSNTVSNVNAHAVEIDSHSKVKTSLGHDDKTSKTAVNMIDQTLSLMENYAFSVEQLEDMSNSLNSLSVAEQRAYLSISENGFELLVGAGQGRENKLSLEGAEETVAAIDKVRDSHQARDVVYKSRMGNNNYSSGASDMFELKREFQAVTDQKNMVNLLVADAYFSLTNREGNAFQLNNQNSEEDSYFTEHTNALATNLNELNADDRDKISASLGRLVTNRDPLVELEEESLAIELTPFYQRSSSFAQTGNIEELVSLQQQLNVDNKRVSENQFWVASSSAGNNLDKFIRILQLFDRQGQQTIIDFFAANNSDDLSSDAQKNQMESNKQEFLDLYLLE
jgi:hypothetical protein